MHDAQCSQLNLTHPIMQGEAECNLAMDAGQEFLIVEGDSEGWSKVQRLEGGQEEGYVPTAFLQQL